jgi:hypothetical protein
MKDIDTSNWPLSRTVEERITKVERDSTLVDPKHPSKGHWLNVYTEHNSSIGGKYSGPLMLTPAFFRSQHIDPRRIANTFVVIEYRKHPSGEGAEFGSVTRVYKKQE